MNDLYLRAETEEALKAALAEAGLTGEASHRHALDLIGALYDDQGNVLEGFHANLRLLEPVEIPESLQALIIDAPATPQRAWAS